LADIEWAWSKITAASLLSGFMVALATALIPIRTFEHMEFRGMPFAWLTWEINFGALIIDTIFWSGVILVITAIIWNFKR
jgi:hypothetical protein